MVDMTSNVYVDGVEMKRIIERDNDFISLKMVDGSNKKVRTVAYDLACVKRKDEDSIHLDSIAEYIQMPMMTQERQRDVYKGW